MIRHPKEGRFNSHRVTPRFPLSAPKSFEMVAHASQRHLGSTQQGRIYSVPHWGSALLKGEDTKVETANEGRFFITNMHCEGVDGVKLIGLKLTKLSLVFIQLNLWKPIEGLALVHHYKHAPTQEN